jgi:hypothetical protein
MEFLRIEDVRTNSIHYIREDRMDIWVKYEQYGPRKNAVLIVNEKITAKVKEDINEFFNADMFANDFLRNIKKVGFNPLREENYA